MHSPTEFLEALAQGDADAWRQFLDRHGRLVLLISRRMGLGREDAEDVFQMTFLKAQRGLRSLRDPERLTSWVYSIAYNEAVRMRNRRALETGPQNPPDGAAGAVPAPEEAPNTWAERLDLSERVDQALGKLDPRCQRLLRALYSSAMPAYADVAAELGIPVGSIGPTRARCLEKLREHLHFDQEGIPIEATESSEGVSGGRPARSTPADGLTSRSPRRVAPRAPQGKDGGKR